MSDRILRWFCEGTQHTETASRIGVEIETDFVDQTGRPGTASAALSILATLEGRPPFCSHKLELGRQKIEVAVSPQRSPEVLLERAHDALEWLYGVAARHGVYPRFDPDFASDEELLLITNDRDERWAHLDGPLALEELCRCSSVQFTLDVNPNDAIARINSLWRSRLHEVDYETNVARWGKYLRASRAHHPPSRFAGPSGFSDLEEYSRILGEYPVLMQGEGASSAKPNDVDELDIDLFLRSVWWHHRLRRFGNTLALEVRPLSRRSDVELVEQWKRVEDALF